VIRRSALFRRSSSFGIGPKLSRPRMRLHKPGPLEGKKPREAQWPALVPARSPIRRTRTDRNKYIIWMIDVAFSLINL
ncbi:hypothetical protein KTE29_29845, partial [Burkholderia multivorans]|uniref:hypothetical protein n=1 Tax=Burkholderia multivorans TaxID=87883 RepID=UPI001C239569